MQIVLVTTSHPARQRRASEPSYTAIARELAARGHDVTALACDEKGLPAHEELDGVRVVRTLAAVGSDETRAGTVGRQCRALQKALRGPGRSAVVFGDTTDLPAALLGVAGWGAQWVDLGFDWPLTAFAASHPWWQHARGLSGLARLSARSLGAAVDPPDVQRAGFLVWNEARWKDLLLRGLPVQSARVLRPGVDTDLFSYRRPAPADGEVRMQYQGPLRREGGLNAVFLAMQELPAAVRLRIVAESTEESYLAELGELGRAAGVMDRVEVHPAAGEAQRLALLREAHVFLQSREAAEELPRYALEAAAAGVPVVAARIHGGDGGDWPWGADTVLEFPAGDPRSLAACVQARLDAPEQAERRSRAARRLVEARFGVTYSVDQLEPLLTAE